MCILQLCRLRAGTSKVEPHGYDGGDDEDSEECHSICHVLGTVLSSMNSFDS